MEVVSGVARTSTLLLNSLVVELLVSMRQFLLGALNFVHQLTLVEGLLRDDLSAQVLDLGSQALLNSVVLLPHDLPPDGVKLIEDLTDASLRHLAIELVLDL